jgi:hypothetical protein
MARQKTAAAGITAARHLIDIDLMSITTSAPGDF